MPSSLLVPTRGLIIREPWVSHILAGEKDWELRSKPTTVRGRIALIQGGSGLVVGVATLIDVEGPFTEAQLLRTVRHHRVPRERVPHIGYATPHAWVLRDPIRLVRPVPYDHPSGAVIWVTLAERTQRAIRRTLRRAA